MFTKRKAIVKTKLDNLNKHNRAGILLDLSIYIATMFLIREIYFNNVSFITNGLFWSFTTLIVASWRMKARDISWQDLGLVKPKSFKNLVIATGFIFAFIPISIILFNILKDLLPVSLAVDTSSQTTKFGELKGNWLLFFSIIPFIWIQSMLEELLDRGFLINWIEKMFSESYLATIFAVVTQATIFGFRHSYDLSERSITVGLIGLIMGLAYVLFGRNLWPLIIAHCTLNTVSMLDRVT